MTVLLIGFILFAGGLDLIHSVTAFPFDITGCFSYRLISPYSLLVYEVTVDGNADASNFRSTLYWSRFRCRFCSGAAGTGCRPPTRPKAGDSPCPDRARSESTKVFVRGIWKRRRPFLSIFRNVVLNTTFPVCVRSAVPNASGRQTCTA